MTFALLVVLFAGPDDEASRRFDAAVARYNRGDPEGALVEFQRVQELAPRASVLFNIGMIQGSLGRAAEAHASFTAVLAAPGSLSAERRAKARAKLAELEPKVGRLNLRVRPADASIDVDGKPAGSVVLAGKRLVAVTAPKHVPRRIEVLVPPGGSADVEVELEPEKVAVLAAQLQVTCSVPAADVFVDGVRVAVTPLYSTLAVPPGTHRVSVARAGYAAAEREVTLAEGAIGRLVFELEEDAARPADADVQLQPACSQTQVQLSVDGVRRGVDVAALRVPPGAHVLLFERAGFYPLRREVSAAAGAVVPVTVSLEPTPELRAELSAQARRHRFAAVLSFAAGGLLLAGGAGYLVYNFVTLQEVISQHARMNQTLECATTEGRPVCEQLEAEGNLLFSTRWLGWAGVSLGALGVVAGVIALLTTPGLSGDGAPSDGVLAPVFGLTVGPAGGAVTVSGRF